jgi:energy-coupling factor transporter transmembrane protein EcfT
LGSCPRTPSKSLHSSSFRGLRTVQHAFGETRRAERLARKPGWLQQANPVLKLTGFLALVVGTSLLRAPLPIFAMWLLALTIAAATKLPLWGFLVRTLAVSFVFGMLVSLPALLNWFVPGTVMFRIAELAKPPFNLPHTLAVTYQGFHSWLLLSGRVGATFSLSLLLIWTTPFLRMVSALRRMRLPAQVTMLLMISYRYIIMLLVELQNLPQARVSRQLGRLSTHTEQAIAGSGIGYFYLRSQRIADDLSQVMASRGFTGE